MWILNKYITKPKVRIDAYLTNTHITYQRHERQHPHKKVYLEIAIGRSTVNEIQEVVLL